MQKQPKQTSERRSSKKILVLVFMLSMVLPGAAILLFVTQSNLTYPVLSLFILLYTGTLFFLLKEITGDKKVNQELKLEKENFRTILYNIGEGLITAGKEGQVLYMNPAAERLTGWNWREAKNKPLHEIFNVVNEETGKPIEHIVSRILKDGKPIEFENNTILRAKDKHRMIISNNGSPLVDSSGNISGAVLVFNDITERKKADKEIRDYKSALDESSIVDVSDENGIIRYANENFCRISKYSKEELIGQDHRILSSGYHNTAFIKNLWETVSSGKVWRGEVKNKKKDGNYYWVDTTIVPFLDSQGKPFQYITIRSDITERKEAEDKLIQNEQQFRLLLNSTAQGIYGVDMDGNCTFVNAACLKILGYGKEEELLGQHIHTLIHHTRPDGSHYPSNECRMYKALSGHEGIHVSDECFWRSDGSSFPVEYWSHPIVHNEQVVGAVATFFDITERKLVEQKLWSSEEKYRNLVEQAADAIMVFDFRGKILSANTSSCLALGYDKKTLLKLNLTDIIPERYKGKLPIDLSELSVKKAVMVEREFIRCDGSCFYTEVSAQLTADGNIQTFVRDITDRKQAEANLQKSKNILRAVLDNAPIGIWMQNSNGQMLFVNQAFCNSVGIPEERFLEVPHYGELYSPEVAAACIASDKEAIAGRGPQISHERLLFTDGKMHDLEIIKAIITEKQNGTSGLIGLSLDITERKKAEEKLLQLSQVVEQSPVSIVITDTAGSIEYVNPKFVEITGYSFDEAIGKNPRILKSGHTSGEEYEQLWKTLTSGEEWHGELQNKKKNGNIYWEWATISPILDAQGETTHFLAVKEDITERKQTEEKIRKFNERFEMIAATTHDAVWEWNFEPNELWANEMHQRLYGLTPADPVPTAEMWEQKIHPDDREAVLKNFERIMTSDKNIWIAEYRFKTQSGEYINIYDRTYIIRNADGKAIRTMGSMMDITERKKAEDALREKEFILTEAQRIAHIGSWIFELSGKITWTQEAYNIYGVSPDNFIPDADSFNNLIHPDDRAAMQDWINNCVAGNKPGELEFRAILPDGTTRLLSGRGELEYDAQHKPLYMRGTVQDITEHKKAEEEILEVNKRLRSLSEYLQNVREEERTHMAREIHDELGQQLTVMKMDVAWLNEKLKKTDASIRQRTEELKDMLDKTVITVRRIASELRPSMLDDMGLGAAIEWHLSEFEKRSGVKTEFDKMQTELPLPDTIKTGLFRIVQESLTNVGRYAKAKKVTVSLQQKDGQLALRIKDNGVGFDIAEKIAAKKTLGILGMTERCYMMGGTCNISSAPGKGTTVAVKVPFGE